MGSASDDIAAVIIAKWSAAFAKLDADALSSLYSKSALFYGSNPMLYRGREGGEVLFHGIAALECAERPVYRHIDSGGRRRRGQHG